MWWTARTSTADPQSVSARRGLDRDIWRLGLPAFGALVAHPVFLLIDAAIVGTLGTAPLAGLGAATTVISAVVGLCVFLAYATTSSVARLLGANDRAGALAQGLAGMLLGLGLGVVLGIAVWWTAPLLARGLGTTGEVTDFSVTYLRIIAISLPAMLGVLAGVGVLRGLQDTKTTLVVTLSQVGVNLVLSLVLVLGLGWGIAGSAVGTAVAEFVGLFAYGAVLMLLVRRAGVPVVPTMAGIVRAARDGVPLFIRTIALRIVFLVAAAAAARLGSPELAAYHVTATLFFALALALDALAIAGQALLGKVLGASDAHSARLITRRLLYWSVWLGLALAVFVLVIRPWLPGWFSNDEAVIAIMSSALIIVAVQQPLAGAVFALDGILIGAGDTRFLAWAQIAVLGGFIPAAWWVVQSGWGVDGLWWSIAWFLLLRLIILGWRAHGSAWIVTGAVRQK